MREDLFFIGEEKYKVNKARVFKVVPKLPEKLLKLKEIAYNMWWCWNYDAVELFYRLDRRLWDKMNHNPVKMLGIVSQERFEELADDDSFLAHLDRVYEEFKHYQNVKTWYEEKYGKTDGYIAYFSAEFGLHESIPNYSGGLGILAGDHLKSASDIGAPIIGVGLLYRYGYFQQYLNNDGWQQEEYIENHFNQMSLIQLKDEKGNPIIIKIPFFDRDVFAEIWKIQVGRVSLFMLTTDIPENNADDREITSQLYGGDQEMRIKQEIVLGIGGIIALEKIGIRPKVCHMNEGHSAFLGLERIRQLMEKEGLSFQEARMIVRLSTVFTTHTPVPAGNDVFPASLIDKYFSFYWGKLGLDRESFLNLGQPDKATGEEKNSFSMTILAIKLSSYINGVSRLHGAVSRRLWNHVWPFLPRKEVPIGHITNGVHLHSWLAREVGGLYDRYMGPRWKDEPLNNKIWERVYNIPDAELWRTHERRKERLVTFVRKRLKQQLLRKGASRNEIEAADEMLDPEALTIGFARRFATYKRATLIFKDLERLKKILTNKDYPVQIIFAGKAHPKDVEGKELIKKIYHYMKDEDLLNKVVFIENYDMNVARYLVQGVDVWLNNPRRPLEASGTSGMKVPVNGGINFSVLDGWWCEGFNGTNGWPIGQGEEYVDTEYQDKVESEAIYHVLETEIIPTFFNRGRDGVPREWVKIMKNSIVSVCSYFNTNRMVSEYVEKYYQNCLTNYDRLTKDGFSEAKKLAQWVLKMRGHWSSVKILESWDNFSNEVEVETDFEIRAKVYMDGLSPEDLSVEVYYGRLDSRGNIVNGEYKKMELEKKEGDNYIFKTKIKPEIIGQNGYTIRILPGRDEPCIRYSPSYIIWQQ